MFDFEKFNNELDEQNAALESLLADLDDADNDIDCASPVSEMLEKVGNRLENCTTAEECYDLLTNLNVEVGKFNNSIETMKIAAEQFQVDDDKDALKANIAPAVENLTNMYNIISMEGVTTVGDAEIQTLRDFLTGSNDLIQNKYNDLIEGGSEDMYGNESYLYDEDDLDLSLESYFDDDFDIAEEGLGDKLKAAKDAVIKFLKGLIQRIKNFIAKLKRQNQSETDPKVKAETSKAINQATKIETKCAGLIGQAEKAPDADSLREVKEEGQKEQRAYNAVAEGQKATIRNRMMDDEARRAAKGGSVKEQKEAAKRRQAEGTRDLVGKIYDKAEGEARAKEIAKQRDNDKLANQIADQREKNAKKEKENKRLAELAKQEQAKKEREAEWAEAEAKVKAEQDREAKSSINKAAEFKARSIKKNNAHGKKKPSRYRVGLASYTYNDDEYDMEEALEALEMAEEGYYSMFDVDDDFELGLESDMSIAQEGVTDAIVSFRKKLINICNKLMKKCRTKMERSESASRAEKFWQNLYVSLASYKSKLEAKTVSDDPSKADKQMEQYQDIQKGIQNVEEKMKKASSATESFIDQCDEEIQEALENYLFALEDYSDALEAYGNSFEIGGCEQDFIDCAMEGIYSGNKKQEWQIRYGEARKELVALTKSAKKAYKAKDYKKAIAIYKKVESGYRGLLKVAKNMPDQYSLNSKTAGGSDSAKGQAKMKAIEWVNNQISNTQAAIMKCQDKLKKAERKAANESFYDFDDDDLDLGLESDYVFDEDDLDLLVDGIDEY